MRQQTHPGCAMNPANILSLSWSCTPVLSPIFKKKLSSVSTYAAYAQAMVSSANGAYECTASAAAELDAKPHLVTDSLEYIWHSPERLDGTETRTTKCQTSSCETTSQIFVRESSSVHSVDSSLCAWPPFARKCFFLGLSADSYVPHTLHSLCCRGTPKTFCHCVRLSLLLARTLSTWASKMFEPSCDMAPNVYNICCKANQ